MYSWNYLNEYHSRVGRSTWLQSKPVLTSLWSMFSKTSFEFPQSMFLAISILFQFIDLYSASPKPHDNLTRDWQDDLNLSLKTNIKVEGESQPHKVFFWSPQECHGTRPPPPYIMHIKDNGDNLKPTQTSLLVRKRPFYCESWHLQKPIAGPPQYLLMRERGELWQ